MGYVQYKVDDKGRICKIIKDGKTTYNKIPEGEWVMKPDDDAESMVACYELCSSAGFWYTHVVKISNQKDIDDLIRLQNEDLKYDLVGFFRREA